MLTNNKTQTRKQNYSMAASPVYALHKTIYKIFTNYLQIATNKQQHKQAKHF